VLVDEGAGVNGKSLFDFDHALAPLLLRPVSPVNVNCNGHVLDWASSKSLSSMLTGSSSRSRLDDSVGYALLPADWSLASSSAPPLEPLVSDQGGNFGSAKSEKSDRRRQIFRSAGIRSAEPSNFVGKIGESAKSGDRQNRQIGKSRRKRPRGSLEKYARA